MRIRRSLILIGVVVVVSAAVASGVTYLLVGRDSVAHAKPLPPVALVGVLRDASGRPVAVASVHLLAEDTSSPAYPQRIPLPDVASGTTDSAGRFTIRLSTSVPIIRKIAAVNGAFVNFDLDIRKGNAYSVWAVPRDISHHVWFADGQGTPAASKVERITYRPFVPGSH